MNIYALLASAVQMRLARLAVATVMLTLPALVGRADEAELQGSIERVLAEEGLVGISWALVGETGKVSLGAAGLRDNESRTRFSTETRFHVGSVAKSVLATTLLRLVTTGAIGLDVPVTHYLPDLRFDNPWEEQSVVTVRNLLDHTSGLDDARLWQMFSERPGPDTPLVAAFPDSQTLFRIRSRPGSRYSYSNMGYTLLGLIIESVTGERYETYLDNRVLAPLGMHDSTSFFTVQEGDFADPMLAWGHVDDGTRYAASPVFLRPSGQFTTTAADLATFAKFLLGDGNLDGRPFIDKELMHSRGHPSTTETAANGLVAGYALGLARRDRHGVVGYCHGGSVVGFAAMLCIFPEERKAFAYSINTDSETADYGRIDGLLVNALGVAKAPAPQIVDVAEGTAQWNGRYVLRPNRFETFRYLDTVFGAIKLTVHAESITITGFQRSPRKLRPTGSRLFKADDRTTASHILLIGEEGELLVSDGFSTYEKVSSTYLAAHWSSVCLGLLGLTWLFLTGLVSLIRYRGRISQRPEAPAFIAILLLLVPVPFYMTQSFMALGDLTLASGLLAAATLLLPLGMLMTILQVWRLHTRSRIIFLHGVAATFVLQWCVVLASAGLLPLTLWS